MTKKLDLSVVKYLILAQTSSDGGKQIYELDGLLPLSAAYLKKGYAAKDSLLKKAVKRIQCNKNTGFRFYIKQSDEFMSDCFIIYFNFKLDGKRYQISFHSFSDWSGLCNSSFSTRWDHRCSRETALVLCDYFYTHNTGK